MIVVETGPAGAGGGLFGLGGGLFGPGWPTGGGPAGAGGGGSGVGGSGVGSGVGGSGVAVGGTGVAVGASVAVATVVAVDSGRAVALVDGALSLLPLQATAKALKRQAIVTSSFFMLALKLTNPLRKDEKNCVHISDACSDSTRPLPPTP